MNSKIIVALDGFSSMRSLLSLAKKLRGYVWGYKVNDALLRWGVRVVSDLLPYGKVMTDPKLYDIPNTIYNSTRVLSEAGASMITVHACSGMEGLSAARAGSLKGCKVLAVTMLTSDSSCNRRRKVMEMAQLAHRACVDGVVCSGGDLESLQSFHSLLKVTPGVRPFPRRGDDQKHITTNIPTLADFIIIGRPILEASDDALMVIRSLESHH